MMATYFNGGSEIQADNLQTLYLMNPRYTAYSDTQAPSGMLLLNPAEAASAPSTLTPASLQHQPNLPSHQHLVGVPVATGGSASHDSSRTSLHEIPGSSAALHGHVSLLHYNLWGTVAADPASSGGGQTQIPTAIAVSGGRDLESPMGFRRPQPVSLATSTSLDRQQQQQGLSLSLNNSSPNKNVAGSLAVLSAEGAYLTSASGVTNGVTGGGAGGAQSVILGSKYRKAAQQLLDEVVNVGKATSMADSWADRAKDKVKTAVVGAGEGSSTGGGGGKSGGAAELTTTQRQELQMKKTKLLNMLDEVEQRYRQYHNQMQIVASSFEQAVGAGSAKSYMAVALQTISKQFRCLKNAIMSQVKATGKTLGEDDDSAGEQGEGSRSRLRLVDHHSRQQRALQQLGMMQHNAWRPQRGLPERAVSVLRAWLFEHFLHPYPKDSDKHILAKQTGLTRSQVSNWFINARVRLWKPMVEEMYTEEMKTHQQNGLNAQATNNNEHKEDSIVSSKSTASHQLDKSPRIDQTPLAPPPTATDISNSTLLSPPSASTPPTLHGLGTLQGFSVNRSSEMESMIQRSPKRQRNSDMQNSPSSILSTDMEMKPGRDPSRELFCGASTTNNGGFGAYPIADIGSRFNPDQQLEQQYHHGNAVSLTLGPPHCENLSLSENHHHHHQHNFIPARPCSWAGGWTWV